MAFHLRTVPAPPAATSRAGGRSVWSGARSGLTRASWGAIECGRPCGTYWRPYQSIARFDSAGASTRAVADAEVMVRSVDG